MHSHLAHIFIAKVHCLEVYVTRGQKELFRTKLRDLQVCVTRGHIIFPIPAVVDLRMPYVVSAT